MHASLPGGETATFTVEKPGLLIGRSRGADIRLSHQTVSASHARITRDDANRWMLEDLGSRNGIVVSGGRVDRVAIGEGAVAELGSFHVRFTCSSAPGGGMPEMTIAPGPRVTISRLGERDATATTRQRITEIAESGKRLWTIDEEEQRRAALCQLLVSPLMSAWSAVVVRLETASGRLTPLASATHRAAPADVVDYVSKSMIEAIQADPAPAVGRTHGAMSGELNLSIAPEASSLAAMICRLEERPGSLDLLFLTLPPTHAEHSQLLELAMIAEQYRGATAAALLRRRQAESARREAELQRAHEIQENLLPDARIAAARGAMVHALPCHEVGGDYADIIPLDEHRTLLVVADVSGKGLHAALVAAQIFSLCNFAIPHAEILTGLAERLNALLSRHLSMAVFASAVLVLVDREAGGGGGGGGTVSVLNAGHPPPLLAEADGTVSVLADTTSPPLGVLDEPPPVVTSVISPGSTLLLYTDGLTELSDASGAMLGVDGVCTLFREACAGAEALEGRMGALVGSLDRLNGLHAHQHDDQTVLMACLGR